MRSRSFHLSVVGASVVLAGCASAQPQPQVTKEPDPNKVSVNPGASSQADPDATNLTNLGPETLRGPESDEGGRLQLSARAIYVKALTYFEDRDWDRALLEFQRCLNVDPTFYKALFKIALCYYNKQQYALEIQYYERCLDLNPTYVEALRNCGNAYLAADELEKAVRMYQRVLKDKLVPDDEVALYNLGLVYFDLQQYELSIKYLDRYIRAHPDGVDRVKAERHLKQAQEMLEHSHAPK